MTRRVIPRRHLVRCRACDEVLTFVAIDEQDYQDKLAAAGWQVRAPGGAPDVTPGTMCPGCVDIAKMWKEDDDDDRR